MKAIPTGTTSKCILDIIHIKKIREPFTLKTTWWTIRESDRYWIQVS